MKKLLQAALMLCGTVILLLFWLCGCSEKHEPWDYFYAEVLPSKVGK